MPSDSTDEINVDIYARAVQALRQRHLRDGCIPQRPSAVLSYRNGDEIILVNVRGALGRYRLRPNGGPRWIDARTDGLTTLESGA